MSHRAFVWVLSVSLILINVGVHAQRGGQGGGRGCGSTGRRARECARGAPVRSDRLLVSLVSDEWRYRMLTPPKGNVDYVPINAEGRRVAQAWDPAQDAATGGACKGYGPVGLMRLPGRLQITWQDPNTLKIDSDSGTQTRLFHMGENQAPAGHTPSLQGVLHRGMGVLGRSRRSGPTSPRPAQSGDHGDDARIPAQERRAV